MLTKKEKRKQGKLNKAHGAAWESRVRKYLTEEGWNVAKFQNNVDLEADKMIAARGKYNPFSKAMMITGGFPDFITFRPVQGLYEVVGVECKIGKYLDKEEKEKCRWYLNNNVFNKILIASKQKIKNRIHINLDDFEEKYGLDNPNI